MTPWTSGVLAALWAIGGLSAAAEAQAPVGRAAAERLVFPELDFQPPVAEEYTVAGVSILALEDHTLPLVTMYVRFKGGYALLGRELYAAATALPSLLRFGGTETLSPDSVDKALEYYAIQTSFGTGGEAISATMNTLVEHLPTAIDLFGALLTEPAFDADEIEVWRGRQLESVARRADDPGRLAYSEFNRLLYGDHPVGWEMEAGDLETEDLSHARLTEVHSRIACRENLVLGVTGASPRPEGVFTVGHPGHRDRRRQLVAADLLTGSEGIALALYD